MADLPEIEIYDAGVYQLETTDPVVGGVNGKSNASAKNLANRTKWLKARVDALIASAATFLVASDLNGYWNNSNDGTGSGLDADLLDGKHASEFALNNQSVSGTANNLLSSATGTSATVLISADELIVRDVSYKCRAVQSVSVSIITDTNGANGLDTGTIAANTWYSTFIIYNNTTATIAGLCSLSATAPTLPSGYTEFAKIGDFKTNGTANKYPLDFIQVGGEVNIVAVQMAAGTTAIGKTALSVAAFIPVAATAINVGLSAISASSPSAAAVYIYNKLTACSATSASNSHALSSAILILHEKQLDYSAGFAGSNGDYSINCIGWRY